jgi:hypothetical protein
MESWLKTATGLETKRECWRAMFPAVHRELSSRVLSAATFVASAFALLCACDERRPVKTNIDSA